MFPGPPPARARRLATLLLAWFRSNARDLPWRRTRDPYAIWVSEVMLQQTQVKTVIPYWERWMRELPTVEALAGAPIERVLKHWEGLGYYTRARNLQRAARMIAGAHRPERRTSGRRVASSRSHHAGIRNGAPFPRDFEALLALPGIGRYTAGAICSIAFNQPAPVLDGNVIRVLTRLFGIAADVREKTVASQLWALSAQLVAAAGRLPDAEDNNCAHFNQAMMELGATVCTPRQPRCADCPWRPECVARRGQIQESLPKSGRRPAPTAREFHAFVLERNGRLMLRQRPTGVVNAGLWEFPNAEAASWQEAARQLGLRLKVAKPLCEVRHSITKHRIRLRVWRVKAKGTGNGNLRASLWLKPAAADRRAFTSAHRKVLRRLVSAA